MRNRARFDVAVVGSGFGGSVTALRLTEKGYRVAVVESGRRFAADEFARSSWNLRRFLWFPWLGMRGIQRIDLLRDAVVLSGAGVGGGSLAYANTLIEPKDAFFTDRQWAGITDWKAELAPHYDRARRMLGAGPARNDTPADDVTRAVARYFDAEATFGPTDVGVHFGDRPGRPEPDPYFGGAGPARTACTECGGCMVGCRYDAKNSLDRNYLYLAEAAGARVMAGRRVVDIEATGSGYRLATRRPGAWLRRRCHMIEADQVVLAAGALGTTRLLLKMQGAGRLNGLSERVGHLVRTNSEAILAVVARQTSVDYSRGVAITSAFEPDADTRIEPVRYPAGSNSMGLLASILVSGNGGRQPLRFLAAAARHPLVFLRSLSVRRWAERTMILLVMQSFDNSLRLRLRRGRLGSRLASEMGHGPPNPRWIPLAHEATREAARIMSGDPTASLNESLFGVPLTAHILGGACIAASAEEGVVDPYHRAFGLDGLHVIDGAAVGANLGANPSLTITAMAERAVSMWPNKGEPDPRPRPGEPYRPIGAVPPADPAVPPGAPAAFDRNG